MLMKTTVSAKLSHERCRTRLQLNGLAFGPGDVTAGSEDELQAVVAGKSESCDLPTTIRESRFFRNISKRISSGEAPRQAYIELQAFLSDGDEVWENSWVRFPERKLSMNALEVFHTDLGMSPSRPSKRRRTDSAPEARAG
jgi:hypothetical protein